MFTALRDSALALVLSCMVVASLAAQEGPEAVVEQVTLSVSPAPQPQPALKHSLWLTQRELKPGNAAPFYYRAILLMQQNAKGIDEKFNPATRDGWSNLPLADLPKDEVRAYLDAHASVFKELETATSREECQWDLRVTELKGMDIISFLLPEFQSMRDLGRLLALKARLEIAEGKFEHAIVTLRMGYRVARDTAEPPLLINALIGIAIGNIMNQAVIDFIDAPGSPNLYWALKQLPHPLIDIRPAMEFELGMPYQMFPFLKNPETAERTPEEWQRMVVEGVEQLQEVSGEGKADPALDRFTRRVAITGRMMVAYSAAKKSLLDEGMPAEEIEKMPVAQVIAIHAARSYRYTYQEVFKWSLLEFAEARPQLQATMERLQQEGRLGDAKAELLPIASLLMPAIDAVVIAEGRSARRFAALETLEALRIEAATSGRFPEALDDLDKPAPANPMTGKPFGYRLEEGRAVVEELSPEAVDSRRANDRRYQIELSK